MRAKWKYWDGTSNNLLESSNFLVNDTSILNGGSQCNRFIRIFNVVIGKNKDNYYNSGL